MVCGKPRFVILSVAKDLKALQMQDLKILRYAQDDVEGCRLQYCDNCVCLFFYK